MKRQYLLGEINEATIIFIGPSGCGKTTLLATYLKLPYDHEYVPTVIDTFYITMTHDEMEINLLIWDTSGTSTRLAEESINFDNLDLVCFCYSIDCRSEFENAAAYWEVFKKNYTSMAPAYLISMKSDLRKGIHTEDLVTYEEGKKLAEQINAVGYMETSAYDNVNIDEVISSISNWVGQNIFYDPRKQQNRRKVCY